MTPVLDEARHALPVLRHVWTHPSNAGQRGRAVLRSVRFQVRGRLGRRTLTRIGRGGHMWAELHYTASSASVYGNPPDFLEMTLWRRVLRPGDVFIDVGSNVGSYALWAGDLGATVLAVEPSPSAVERLRENVALNDFAIEVHACALSSASGVARMTENLGTVNHLVLGDGSAEDEERETVVSTLDDLIAGRTVRGVKIDVEGAERLVLQGGVASLAAGRIDVLQLEWNGMSHVVLGEDRQPVATLLRGFGYELFRPTDTGRLVPVVDLTDGPDVFALSPAARAELGAPGPS